LVLEPPLIARLQGLLFSVYPLWSSVDCPVLLVPLARFAAAYYWLTTYSVGGPDYIVTVSGVCRRLSSTSVTHFTAGLQAALPAQARRLRHSTCILIIASR